MKELLNAVRIIAYLLLILLVFEAVGYSPIALAEKNWQELVTRFNQQPSNVSPLPTER